MRQMNRPDPSPSRLRYRMERLKLTPGFQFVTRFGVPVVAVLSLCGWWLSDEARRAELTGYVAYVRAEIEARPEFSVRLMAVDGASEPVAALVHDVLVVDFPVSSFDLDLEAMRDDVAKLPPVKSAHVRIRQGGILQVEVEERMPAALWRTGEQLALVDAEGVTIGLTEDRAAWPELPVMAGEGADVAVSEALRLARAAGPITDRLRGFVRVGERRWDVVLTNGQRVLLPQKDPVSALERVIAMDEAVDLLKRDVAVVDLRIGRRPVLRLGGYAAEELLKVKGLKVGEE